MKIIVGLGNPGKEYQDTRHNVGFMVLDKFVEHKEIASTSNDLIFESNKKFQAKICDFRREGERLLLVKPQTFMNNSGQAVAKISSFYNIDLDDLWVVADDLDLPAGCLRVRLKGSSGGHKGLQSIIDSLGSDEFARIRVGIDEPTQRPLDAIKPENQLDADSFVLSRFTKKSQALVDETIEKAAEIIVEGIKNRVLKAHTY